jgi:hypothetical protein
VTRQIVFPGACVRCTLQFCSGGSSGHSWPVYAPCPPPSQTKHPPQPFGGSRRSLDGGRALCCNPCRQAGPTAWLSPRAVLSREAISIVLSKPAHIIRPTCAQVKPSRGPGVFQFRGKRSDEVPGTWSYFGARGGSDKQPFQILS